MADTARPASSITEHLVALLPRGEQESPNVERLRAAAAALDDLYMDDDSDVDAAETEFEAAEAHLLDDIVAHDVESPDYLER